MDSCYTRYEYDACNGSDGAYIEVGTIDIITQIGGR